jgi:hypothetical protein
MGVLPSSASSREEINWLLAANSLLASESVKLLLAFASTVIPGFSLLVINDQDFYSLLEMYVFQNWAKSKPKSKSLTD